MFVRKKIRLKNKDLYKANFWYFITVCTKNKTSMFVKTIKNINVETVKDGHVKTIKNINVETVKDGHKGMNNHKNKTFNLNAIGKIIENSWLNLPNSFENIILDEYIVMPNHFHGIIGFNGKPISKFTGNDSDLGKIIKRFKLDCLRQINELISLNYESGSDLQTGDAYTYNEQWRSLIAATIGLHKTIWQKSFHDHIIRDGNELERIQEYILNNPAQWDEDILNSQMPIGVINDYKDFQRFK